MAPPPSNTEPALGVLVTLSGQQGIPCLITFGPRALKANLAASAAPHPWHALPGVIVISLKGICGLVILSLIVIFSFSLLLNPCYWFFFSALSIIQDFVSDHFEVMCPYFFTAKSCVEL
jgi:hypothetical protein